jgi:outer membrane protein assembly factor BamB
VVINVIDGDTRAPLPDATVTPYDANAQPVAPPVVADASGQAAVPPQSTLIQAITPGYETDARTLAAGRTTLTIPLYNPVLQSPEYGGGPTRTRYVPAVKLPTPPQKATWKWEQRALLEFPPAVSAGIVAITTGSGRITLLKAQNGNVIWTKRHTTTAPIAASPAISFKDRAVLVAGMDGRLVSYALDAPGTDNWTFSTGQSKIESSPLISDGIAYIGAHNGRLYAVTMDKGQEAWDFQAADDIKGSVAKSGDTIVFGDYSGTLYALSASTHKLIWRQRVGKRLYGGPGISGNTVVVGDVGGAVIALDLRNGRQLWRHPVRAAVYSSPAIANDRVYIGSYTGTFEALDLKTGNQRCSFNVGGPISGSATVVGDVVYTSVLARPGQLDRSFGLDTKTCKKVWRGNDGRYSPAVGAGNTLYIVGRTTLYAYREP